MQDCASVTQMDDDRKWMQHALQCAHAAEASDEVPVGAVLLGPGGALIAEGYNQPISTHDPTAHAEIVVLRKACHHLENYRLPAGCTLYVTLEPCAMCMGALVHARLSRLVYACHDPKSGMAGSVVDLAQHPQLNHHILCHSGVCADESAALLKAFFKKRR